MTDHRPPARRSIRVLTALVVAALGEGFQVVLGGEVVGIGGTSASTPMFAGLISLINEARIAKGGKPMG